eukprot:1156849-Pelagomonas_calceolata.AAC.2
MAMIRNFACLACRAKREGMHASNATTVDGFEVRSSGEPYLLLLMGVGSLQNGADVWLDRGKRREKLEELIYGCRRTIYRTLFWWDLLWIPLAPLTFAASCLWVVSSLDHSAREVALFRGAKYNLKQQAGRLAKREASCNYVVKGTPAVSNCKGSSSVTKKEGMLQNERTDNRFSKDSFAY